MITLTPSGVSFDRETHTYTLDGKELSGITSVIKSRLFPDKYSDVPPQILERAAERGTMIHELVEIYDSIGSDSDNQEVKEYGELTKGFKFLASEFIVTDGMNYASGIDKVFEDGDKVILADIKTTYTLDREYTRWQLSIYKYLIERQCLGLEVSKCYAIWLKAGKSQLVELEPYSTELVEKLLYSEEPMIEEKPISDEEQLRDVIIQYQFWKEKYDNLTKVIKESMIENHDTTRAGKFIRFNLSAPSMTKKFNEKKFSQENPNIYAEYCEEKEVAPRLTVKLI